MINETKYSTGDDVENEKVSIDKNGIVRLNLNNKSVQTELLAKLDNLKKHRHQLLTPSSK